MQATTGQVSKTFLDKRDIYWESKTVSGRSVDLHSDTIRSYRIFEP